MTEVAAGTAGALLAGLDPEQREVALAARGAVCVLAGAGAGKTRAITHRIAYAAAIGVVDPAHVLALTFTVRAAGELRGRLRQLGAAQVRASTFHAAALRQLNYFWPRVVGGRPPRLIDSKAALVREAAQQERVRLDSPGLADAASEIEWAKTVQVRPEGYARACAAAGRSPTAGIAAMTAVYDGYERLRRERHLIDFESVLELTAAIVLEHRGAADQVRSAFRYFVVDEYQDVNPLQKLLLDAWLGDRDDLCVVGDPRQVIYSFTGATPAYLTGFTAEFPGATVVRLARDYRSTPQVVAVANQLIRTGGPALVAQRPAGPQPVLTRYADDSAEAAGLAVQIRALIAAGVPAAQIAVLVRINAETERFERALTEHGVPYVVRGAERFYERPVVRQALVLFRGAARGEIGTDALPAAVRDVLTGIGFTGGPRALGVTGRFGPARRRHVRGPAAGRPGRLCGRADPAGRIGPPPAAAGRHARVDARGQGPGVGRGPAAGPGRGADADRARPDGRRGAGRTAAAVRGGDQGPRAPVPVLVPGPGAGNQGHAPAAVAFPR